MHNPHLRHLSLSSGPAGAGAGSGHEAGGTFPGGNQAPVLKFVHALCKALFSCELTEGFFLSPCCTEGRLIRNVWWVSIGTSLDSG